MDSYFAHRKNDEVNTAVRKKMPFPDYVYNEENTLLIQRDILFQMLIEEEERRRVEKERVEKEAKARPTPDSKTSAWPFPSTLKRGADATPEQGWAKKKRGDFTHKLFDRPKTIEQFQKLINVADSDDRARISTYLDALKQAGEYRKLSPVPSDFREQLGVLREECPNFAAPIAYVNRVLTLAVVEKRPPVFAKILLDGPPGIGKTYFAQRLAKVINSTLHIVHLESMQLSSDLVGNSRKWSNPSPGLIFNVLVDSGNADPIILLDEIDKVRADERFDVNGALLGLLEEGTAAKFKDHCEDWLELDTSRIIYIATSNDAEAIHPAIRSRLKKFDIGAPRDNTAVIKNIFRQVQAEFPTATRDMLLTDGALERLLRLSPRKVREALRDAVGFAADANRLSIIADDIEDTPTSHRIGF